MRRLLSSLHLVSSLVLLFAISPLHASAQPTPPPNVILIMTDDQGHGDFGFHNTPIVRTPNLDQFAAQSTRVPTFYVSPVCAPTRASLMTGRYTYRTRAIDTYIGRAMMEPDETTIAELMGGAGYETGIFGKWHLGDSYPMRPQDQGFDEVLVHRGGGIGQPSDPPSGANKYTNPVLFHNGVETQTTGFCTDVYFDAAIDWLENAAAQSRPFFAYIATNAPHGPFHDVPVELRDHYAAVEGVDKKHAAIYAMIENIDQNVGKLLARLDALSITDNTLVIFMVDNGPNSNRYTSNFRGMKGMIYEGGTRSPLWVRWPEKLKPGNTTDVVTAHIDILPTILDACNIPVPNSLQLDGVSLMPILQNTAQSWPDRSITIQAHRGDAPKEAHNFMIRRGDFKLLRATGFGREQQDDTTPLELYNLASDPSETTNVIADHPEVAAALKDEYTHWFYDVSSTRKDNYAPPRIIVGSDHETTTVLTRQDWRRVSRDGGWNKNSNGIWMLTIETPGPYDVLIRTQPRDADTTVTLRVAGLDLTIPWPKGTTEHTLSNLMFERGNTQLDTEIPIDDTISGAYQVEIIAK